MNKAVVTVLAVLIVMSAVVRKGESYIRAGREMVDKKRGEIRQLPDHCHYDNTEARRNMEARRSSRLSSKRGRFFACSWFPRPR